MLLTLAWRNIWRNRRRSILVMVSVAIGVMALLLYDSVSRGMLHQMLDNQIGSHVSHIQVHRAGFNDNKVIQSTIPVQDRVETMIKADPHVSVYSPRVVTFGLLSSAVNSSGGVIIGIDPGKEAKITSIKSSIVEGGYLSGAPHEVLVGRKLAEKLGVGIGDKVVGMASTVTGDVGSDLFRVVGLFETVSSEFDKSYIYISLPNAQATLEMGGCISEFAIVTDNVEMIDQIRDRLREEMGAEYEVLSYKDIMPMIVAQMGMYEESMYIVYLIIGLAMIFGIINTMLMSVFERIQEIGVLMAIGMRNARIFVMILIEAMYLSVIGTGLGVAIALLLYLPLSVTGVDFSVFSEGLASFGIGAVVYPKITVMEIVDAALIIPVIAAIGAMYPALRAIRLQPIYAIRFV